MMEVIGELDPQTGIYSIHQAGAGTLLIHHECLSLESLTHFDSVPSSLSIQQLLIIFLEGYTLTSSFYTSVWRGPVLTSCSTPLVPGCMIDGQNGCFCVVALAA